MNDGTREVRIGTLRYAVRQGMVVTRYDRFDVGTDSEVAAAVRRVAELEDALRESAEHHEEEAALWGDDDSESQDENAVYHRDRAAILRRALEQGAPDA